MALEPTQHVDAIAERVYETYRSDVLVPSIRRLGSEARAYLAAMAGLLDEGGVGVTSDVAAALGKTTTQLSSCRQRLISRRLIRLDGYGKVRFALPYLSRFASEKPADVERLAPGEWKIR
ncbi:MAG: hypothetical protein IKG21_04540 [Atopobiaceae bacterium]|nr:hypothetical protein [Atopobiaceae bacterium]